MRRLAVIVLVLALLVATTAAFALTEALKLELSPISRPRFDRVFSPTCGCPQSTARLALRLRVEETIDAAIVDAKGARVRTLAVENRRAPGRLVFRWDGTDDAGDVVPDGSYRLRVHLARGRRTIVVPRAIRVDTEPPAVELLSVAPRTLSPDGDGRRDTATVAFRLSEWARPLLLVDGALAFAGSPTGQGSGTLAWDGTQDERPLRAGLYAVTLEARDLAGNVSGPTEIVAVHIRYIELASATVRARRGGVLRFRVLTDAPRFEWSLSRRGKGRRPLLQGAARTGAAAVRLPSRVRAGRYVLRVAANEHTDKVAVVVRPPR